MRIDFISDISCAWCAIGLRAVELALEQLGPPAPEIHIQAFELNPDLGPDGEDFDDYLWRKYGRDEAQREATHALLRQQGAAVGLTIRRRERIWNTFDAQRLLLWAGSQDARAQLALERGLLHAHHAEGRNPSSHAVLIDVAADAGLDADAAGKVLRECAWSTEVRDAMAKWRLLGVNAVPTLIVDGQHLIRGYQPPQRLLQMLSEISKEAKSRLAPQ